MTMPQQRKHQTNSARQAAYRNRLELARKQELSERGLPALPTLASMPGTARWNGAIRRCVVLLTLVHSEMQGYFDDRSESWQESDRGVDHEERITAIEQLLSNLEDLGA
jgi:hypothetical protein